MQNLPLTRPLVVFDLETTGIDVEKDTIVQIAMIRIEPGGERTTFETLVNPEQPIPPGASAVHGISSRTPIWRASTPSISICPCCRRN